MPSRRQRKRDAVRAALLRRLRSRWREPGGLSGTLPKRPYLQCPECDTYLHPADFYDHVEAQWMFDPDVAVDCDVCLSELRVGMAEGGHACLVADDRC